MIFPYGIAEPVRRQPFATVAIIIMTTVASLTAMLGPWSFAEVIARWSYIPAQGSWGSWLAGQFLHADLEHLLGNMWMLVLLGPALESRLGHGPFTLFYFAGGFAAFAISGAASTGAERLFPHFGASGAISALIGAQLALFPFTDIKIAYFFFLLGYIRSGTTKISGIFLIVIWVLLQFFNSWIDSALGRQGGVDYVAHIGGVAFGFIACILGFGSEGIHRESPQ